MVESTPVEDKENIKLLIPDGSFVKTEAVCSDNVLICSLYRPGRFRPDDKVANLTIIGYFIKMETSCSDNLLTCIYNLGILWTILNFCNQYNISK